uniref:Uncharacterized protein n=1 Tax=Arundo donax TaxID=35708 RepID=A0A0A9QAD3_ARUDO
MGIVEWRIEGSKHITGK